MEDDEANPNSQAPSPVPSWLEEQAFSGHLLGAVGGSVLPLSETEEEEEGTSVNVDEEWNYDMDQEFSQWGNVSGQELGLWEEVTVQELYQWEEEVRVRELSPWGAGRHHELHHWEVGMTVQWGDGRQHQLYQWEESVTVQELYQWDEDVESSQELPQWEEDVRGQQLCQWEGEGYPELAHLEADVRGHPSMYQWEDTRDSELSQVGDNSDKELFQGTDDNVREWPLWEKDVSDKKLSQWEERASSQGLSHWGEDVRYKIWDKPLHPENDEDAQTCVQEGRGSSSSVGTEMAGEAARELPSTSPAPGSPTDAEPAAAAALAGAAAEEEPPEPLAPEVEKAPLSPALSEEVPLAGTESPVPVPAPHSPPECSRALLDFAERIICEIVSEAVLEIQGSGQQPKEQRELQQSVAAELEPIVPTEREESPVPAPHSPAEGSQALLDTAQHMSCEAVTEALLESQGPGLQPEEQRELQQSVAAKQEPIVPIEREESPVRAPHRPSKCSQDLLDVAERIICEIVSEALLESKGSGQNPEKQRELQQSVAAELEPIVPIEREESPVCAPHSPPECGQALLDVVERIICEIMSEAWLESQGPGRQPEEQRELQQSVAAEIAAAVPTEREQSPIPAPHSPCCRPCPSPSLLGAQALSEQQEEAEQGSVLAEKESEEGALAGEDKDWECHIEPELSLCKDEQDLELSQGEMDNYQDVSQGEDFTGQEPSQGDGSTYQELSEGDEHSEQGLSQVEVSSFQELSEWDEHIEPELSQGEVSTYQEASDWEEGIEQELSQVDVRSGQELSDWDECVEQELSQGDSDSYQECSDWEEYLEQGLSQGVGSYHELSEWDECTEQELSQEEAFSYQEFSDWEERTEQRLSQGEVASSPEQSDWEEYSEQELSHGQVGSCKELSDWEESLGRELSEEEASIGQELSKGNVKRPSGQSSWEDDNDKELAQDNWEHGTMHSISVKPLLQEEDEWDKLSVLELPEEEDREQRLRVFAEDGLSLPVPREAWVERRASEPCRQAPVVASPPHVEAQALRGQAASPAFQEPVPEAGTESPVPAPHSCPSPSAPQPGAQALSQQLALHKRRPSRFRRALRALRRLFRCPCLAAPPQD